MFPNATIPERIADGTVHAIGVLGALTGAIMLLMWASGMVSVGVMIALAISGIALIATFAASGTYNMMPFAGPRPMLRRIDHAALYLKIAGTYTPLVVMIGGWFAYSILAIV
jgi:hemolysin III